MILQHTLFEPSSSGHGGNRRSAQISSMLRSVSEDVIVVGHDTPNRYSPVLSLLRHLAVGLVCVFFSPPVLRLSPSLTTLIKIGFFDSELRKKMKNVSLESVILIWESTVPAMFPVVERLARKGVRVVAFPHNVEALSMPATRAEGRMRWLAYERRVLSLVRAVICISPQDTWLYSNLGIPATTWSYQVVGTARDGLAEVRDRRQGSSKDTWLIIGTSGNDATRAGLITLLESAESTTQPGRIALVSRGFPREFICRFSNVEIFPDLPHDHFVTELVRARALVVFQPWGTGQLTRIQEAIDMGIVVYGNELAARGYEPTLDKSLKYLEFVFPGIDLMRIRPRKVDGSLQLAKVRSLIATMHNKGK